MEIGLREWLILIGVVVILAILFDGWRRMRGGKNKLKLQLDPKGTAAALESSHEETTHELLGPARTVPGRASRERDPLLDDELPSISMEPNVRPKRSSRAPEPAIGESIDLSMLEEKALDERPSLKQQARGSRQTPQQQPSPTPKAAPEAPAPSKAKELPPIEEVLVINVIARDHTGFRGTALLQNILESGLRFGDMNIFHRHESMTGNGEILFSMANAVKPGTFDLDDIDRFTTPAVSFFLGLPGPRHPKQAFDLMLAATRKLAQELNGELKDDQRSVLTAQTIEHYRQRIVEFERRQMTLKR